MNLAIFGGGREKDGFSALEGVEGYYNKASSTNCNHYNAWYSFFKVVLNDLAVNSMLVVSSRR